MTSDLRNMNVLPATGRDFSRSTPQPVQFRLARNRDPDFRAGGRVPRGAEPHVMSSRSAYSLFLGRRFRPLVGQHGSEPERLVGGLVGFLVEELPQPGV